MSRSQIGKLALGLIATLGMTSVVVLSSPFHDAATDPPQAPPASGPALDQSVPMPPGLIGVQIALGLKDKEAADWNGRIEIAQGRILNLEVILGPATEVRGNTFTAHTQRAVAKKKLAVLKKKLEVFNKKKAEAMLKKAQTTIVPIVLLANIDVPADAVLTIHTNKGQVEIRLSDLRPQRPHLVLEEQVSVVRQSSSVRLTGAATEDDFPALAQAPDRSVWLAYVAYKVERPQLSGIIKPQDFDAMLVPKSHGDQLFIRRYDGNAWLPALPVTGPGATSGGRPSPSMAGASSRSPGPSRSTATGTSTAAPTLPATPGTVVPRPSASPTTPAPIFTSSRRPTRTATSGSPGRPGATATTRSSRSPPGSDRPRVGLQQPGQRLEPGHRRRRQGECLSSPGTPTTRAITTSGSAPWPRTPSPSSWPTRPGSRAGPAWPAMPQGRVWIAYEEGDEQWGKDYANADVPAHRPGRNPGFAALRQPHGPREVPRWRQAAGARGIARARPSSARSRRKVSVPAAGHRRHGRRLAVRRHHPLPAPEARSGRARPTAITARRWAGPRTLPDSSNLIDNRPALLAHGSGILAVHSSDHRVNTTIAGRTTCSPPGSSRMSRATAPKLVAAQPTPAANLPVVHPNETADKARHARLPRRRPGASRCGSCAASSTATPSTPRTATRTACSKTPGATPSTPPTSTGWATATTTTASATSTCGGSSRR